MTGEIMSKGCKRGETNNITEHLVSVDAASAYVT